MMSSAAGYLFAFAVNTMFYLGFRSEFIYSSYWAWDFVLGYLLLAPFYVSKKDEFCIQNEKMCIENEGFCV